MFLDKKKEGIVKIDTVKEIDLVSFILGLIPKKKDEEKKKDSNVPVEKGDKKEENGDDEDRPIVLKQ